MRRNGTGPSFVIPKKARYEETRQHHSTWSKTSDSTTSRHNNLQPSTRKTENVIWTGSLRYGDQVVESIDLFSPIREGTKPGGFSSSLEVHRLAHWKDCLKYAPIHELVKMPASTLHQKSSILLRTTSKEGSQSAQQFRVSYFYLVNTFSPLFARLCKELKTGEKAAFGVFHDSTVFVLIPDGTLAEQLRFRPDDRPIMHCLFIIPRRCKQPVYTFDKIPRNPTNNEKLDGNDPKALARIERYRRESRLPVVLKAVPKQVDSLFSPGQTPPHAKLPQQPAPRPTGANQTPQFPAAYGKPTFATYPKQMQQYNNHVPQTSVSSLQELLIPPPPPPEPETQKTPNTLANERRQQNRALFANAFKQIRITSMEPLEPPPPPPPPPPPEPEPMAMHLKMEPINVEIRAKAAEGNGFQAATVTKQEPQPMQIPLDNPAAARDPRLSRRMAQIGGQQQFMETQPPQQAPTSSAPAAKEDVKIAAKLPMPPLPESHSSKYESEVLHETAPMDIDESSDFDDQQQPYSPSQANNIQSPSPEPMGMQVVEENDDEEDEVEGMAQKKPAESAKTATNGRIVEEKQKRGEEGLAESAVNNQNIVSSHQSPKNLFTTTTEISEANLTAAATHPLGEAQNEQNTVEDESILTGIEAPKPAATPFASTSTGGFVFDYLDWTSPTHPKSRRISATAIDEDNASEIAKHSDSAQKAVDIDNDEKRQAEEDDKDFRQLWSPPVAAERPASKESPESPKSPIMAAQNQQKPKPLPSLLELKVLPPPQSSPPPQPLLKNITIPPLMAMPPPQPIPVNDMASAGMRAIHQVRSVPAQQTQQFPGIKFRMLDNPSASSSAPLQFQRPPPSLIPAPTEHSTRQQMQGVVGSGLPTATSTKQGNKGILIVDPSLQIIPGQLSKVCEAAKRHALIIKWHASLTKKMEANGTPEEMQLLKRHIASGLVDQLQWHYCDDSHHGPEKQLICTMSLEQQARGQQIIYLADSIDPNSNFAKQLAAKIRFLKPMEFIAEFGSI